MKQFIAIAFFAAIMMAFASCGPTEFVASTPADVTYVRPVAPGPDYIWIDGDWIWTGGRYSWHEGHWARPRPGRTWHAGGWGRVNGGYRWRRGHW